MQKSDRGVTDACRQRSATGSSVVSSTLGHRDLCHNGGGDVASHRHREAAASRQYLTTELMIKHEELSPQSGAASLLCHAGCLVCVAWWCSG